MTYDSEQYKKFLALDSICFSQNEQYCKKVSPSSSSRSFSRTLFPLRSPVLLVTYCGVFFRLRVVGLLDRIFRFSRLPSPLLLELCLELPCFEDFPSALGVVGDKGGEVMERTGGGRD